MLVIADELFLMYGINIDSSSAFIPYRNIVKITQMVFQAIYSVFCSLKLTYRTF